MLHTHLHTHVQSTNERLLQRVSKRTMSKLLSDTYKEGGGGKPWPQSQIIFFDPSTCDTEWGRVTIETNTTTSQSDSSGALYTLVVCSRVYAQ